jgi:3-oxoacyl-[acyl-carrier-protein] synthase II
MVERPRVVVTGLGAVSAHGVGADALWEGLTAGRSGIGPITLYDASEHPVRIAGEATGYEARDHFDRKDLRRLGRFSEFAIVAAREAVAQAGLDFAAADPDRVATVIGSGIGDFETVESQLDVLRRRGPPRTSRWSGNSAARASGRPPRARRPPTRSASRRRSSGTASRTSPWPAPRRRVSRPAP